MIIFPAFVGNFQRAGPLFELSEATPTCDLELLEGGVRFGNKWLRGVRSGESAAPYREQIACLQTRLEETAKLRDAQLRHLEVELARATPSGPNSFRLNRRKEKHHVALGGKKRNVHLV